MNASPDYAASATSTPDSVSAPEMVSQMADVSGAMFSLLLLRTPGSPVDEGIPPSAVAGPAESPAVPLGSVDPSQESALHVPVPVADTDHPPAPVIASIAMPASLPVIDYVPEPGAPLAAAEVAIPVTTSAPPPNMAMLSEIGFLDD